MDDNYLALHDRISVLEANRETDKELMQDVQKKVNEIHDDMSRYKGYLGAITFFGSCLVVFADLFKGWIMDHWK